MKFNLLIRIIVEDPLPDVEYGVQIKGIRIHEVINKQRSVGAPLQFEFEIQAIKTGYFIDYKGKFVYGQKYNRFFYIVMKTYEEKELSIMSRRIRVHFTVVDEGIINSIMGDNNAVFVTRIKCKAGFLTQPKRPVIDLSVWNVEFDN